MIGPSQQLTIAKLGLNAESTKLRAIYGEIGRNAKFLDLLKLSGLTR